MKLDKTLWVLVFISIINSMGFGIIIPLLYSYGKKFGVTEQTIGLLTAAFSISQFFATPVLGSLSDKFGRKPILVLSLVGTCVSFILFGFANSIIMLFAARILDGLTGGNISVAQAMISDISPPKERAKNFGILGSAFGFGFVIGPAVGGLLSKFGTKVPFFFAAGIALLGVILTLFLLKETNKNKSSAKGRFNKFKFKSLITVLQKPVIGTAIFIGFLLTMAQFTMLIGFQTFSVDNLKLNPTQIGLFYAGFGVTGILMQLAVPLIKKVYHHKPYIINLHIVLFRHDDISRFCNRVGNVCVSIGIYGLFNGLRNPMLNTIIADRNEESERGR
jgi:multidrug resistance protein